nr:hypothetical protein [uncultured Lichenicoccus sp.]
MLRYRFVALVALAALLVGAIALELLGPAAGEQVQISAIPARPPAPIGASPPPGDPAGAQAGALQEAWSRTILDRPLFSPSRRPNAAATAAATAPPRLAGIIVGPTGDHAIFAGGGEARATLAGVGARVGPYLIGGISAEGVDVTGPNGREHLLPHYDSAAAPASGLPGSALQAPAPTGGSILDMLRARLRPGDAPGSPSSGMPSQGVAMPGPFRPQVAPASSQPASRPPADTSSSRR